MQDGKLVSTSGFVSVSEHLYFKATEDHPHVLEERERAHAMGNFALPFEVYGGVVQLTKRRPVCKQPPQLHGHNNVAL